MQNDLNVYIELDTFGERNPISREQLPLDSLIRRVCLVARICSLQQRCSRLSFIGKKINRKSHNIAVMYDKSIHDHSFEIYFTAILTENFSTLGWLW